MAAYNKFDCFTLDLATKLHNLNADTLKIMLSNVLPVRTNTVKSNLTEIAAGNGYSAGGSIAPFVSGIDTSGSYKLILSPVVFTAVGGSIGPFQYAPIYNATAAGLNLIAWWDYGTPITITNGNSFTVGLDQTAGTLTLV
ncbi:hypothetical protein ONR75_15830 [Rhodopseudomonas sp. P2A-2r]|uniref:hypothetical protein n=1 Tax=Rhodopseudomonas sp. P2A-2r TaxID=2991972 RepID=UPI002234B72F|nr:hypothetical protein [Rhodopseudomonas sp. P2A-2r]UZE51900.1 hypothetical protein ONR75_15830 [Rhodopseudomonas sp. P2A-2r]